MLFFVRSTVQLEMLIKFLEMLKTLTLMKERKLALPFTPSIVLLRATASLYYSPDHISDLFHLSDHLTSILPDRSHPTYSTSRPITNVSDNVESIVDLLYFSYPNNEYTWMWIKNNNRKRNNSMLHIYIRLLVECSGIRRGWVMRVTKFLVTPWNSPSLLQYR